MEVSASFSQSGSRRGDLYGLLMSRDDPFVRLPDHIELTPTEAGQLLEVLDVAAANVRTDDESSAVRDAVRMITENLWPELGELLDGDDEA